MRQARPRTIMAPAGSVALGALGGRELRRALRHERVLLPDEGLALLADRDDDLPSLAKGIGDDAGVANGNRPTPATVADGEEQRRAVATDRAIHHLSGKLVGLIRASRAGELTGALGLAGGAERGVRESPRQQKGGGERDDEANASLAGRIHASEYPKPPLWVRGEGVAEGILEAPSVH